MSQPVGLFPGKYSVAMVKGDCSLTISNVDLKIDDGEWECQVPEMFQDFPKPPENLNSRNSELSSRDQTFKICSAGDGEQLQQW